MIHDKSELYPYDFPIVMVHTCYANSRKVQVILKSNLYSSLNINRLMKSRISRKSVTCNTHGK
jgi:hypothetical protein